MGSQRVGHNWAYTGRHTGAKKVRLKQHLKPETRQNSDQGNSGNVDKTTLEDVVWEEMTKEITYLRSS